MTETHTQSTSQEPDRNKLEQIAEILGTSADLISAVLRPEAFADWLAKEKEPINLWDGLWTAPDEAGFQEGERVTERALLAQIDQATTTEEVHVVMLDLLKIRRVDPEGPSRAFEKWKSLRPTPQDTHLMFETVAYSPPDKDKGRLMEKVAEAVIEVTDRRWLQILSRDFADGEIRKRLLARACLLGKREIAEAESAEAAIKIFKEMMDPSDRPIFDEVQHAALERAYELAAPEDKEMIVTIFEYSPDSPEGRALKRKAVRRMIEMMG